MCLIVQGAIDVAEQVGLSIYEKQQAVSQLYPNFLIGIDRRPSSYR